ncbi:MAG TPA: hypothetical protein VKY15_02255 [Acidimicrobiales bacterium]|nr:hypothetical protein [Acidimicrobiales bacterium]
MRKLIRTGIVKGLATTALAGGIVTAGASSAWATVCHSPSANPSANPSVGFGAPAAPTGFGAPTAPTVPTGVGTPANPS